MEFHKLTVYFFLIHPTGVSSITRKDNVYTMAKTLTINKKPISEEIQIAPFTEAQLIEMLGKIQSEKPLEPLPASMVADKSSLPPVDERAAAPVQAPANIHGSFGINGIQLIAPGVPPANINPATGLPHAQIVAPQRGGQISPPPSKNFR